MLSFTQPLKGMAEFEEIEKSLEKNQGIADHRLPGIPEGTSDPWAFRQNTYAPCDRRR